MHFPLKYTALADRYYIYLDVFNEINKNRLTYERVVQRIRETTKEKVHYLDALTETDIKMLQAIGYFEQQESSSKERAIAMVEEVLQEMRGNKVNCT